LRGLIDLLVFVVVYCLSRIDMYVKGGCCRDIEMSGGGMKKGGAGDNTWVTKMKIVDGFVE
jgi:hypothetical protein